MNYKNNILFRNPGLVIFLFIFTLIWSTKLFYLWSTDFGHYYVGANSINEGYQLYNEFWEHKGPVYYFFIFIVSKIIGYGTVQAYFVLCITLLIYFLSLFKLCDVYKISKPYLGLILLISTSQLVRQTEDVSLDLFKGALIIFAFIYLINYLNESKEKYLLFSFFFISLAILTRIDSILFGLLYVFIILNEDNKVWLTTKAGLKFSTIFAILFFTFTLIYNFTISEFFIHNIDFNSWRTTQLSKTISFHPILAYLYRPRIVEEFLISGTLLAFILLNSSPKNYLDFKNDANLKLANTVLAIGIISFLISLSEKSYHLFIMYPYISIYFVILISRKKPETNINLLLATFLIITTFFLSPILKTFLEDSSCLTDPFCTESSLHESKQVIEEIKYLSDEQVLIVSSYSWIYLLSETQPLTSLDDNWLYMLKEPYLNSQGLLKSFNLINELDKDEYFYIYKNFYYQNVNNGNQLFMEILKDKHQIIDLGSFLKVVKK